MRSRILLVLTLSILISCKDDKSSTTVKPPKVTFKKEGTLDLYKTQNDSLYQSIDIEIADNDYERETGLMYRSGMEENQAMLFIFPDEDYRSFYMRNTEFPIDIIYLNADKKIVNIQKNTQPLDETSLPSTAPAQYVLEINAGLSDQWSIEAGDSISFKK